MLQKRNKIVLAIMALSLYSVQFLAVGEAAYKRNMHWNQPQSYQYTAMNKKIGMHYKPVKSQVTSISSNGNGIPTVQPGSQADQVIRTGISYMGTPYKARVSGHTLDCSGFVRFIFSQHGISLPGGSYNQVNVGKTVSRSELQKGDLIFFKVGNSSRIGHVALYVGNNTILHTYGKGGVKYDSLGTAWLNHGYVTAKRVL